MATNYIQISPNMPNISEQPWREPPAQWVKGPSLKVPNTYKRSERPVLSRDPIAIVINDLSIRFENEVIAILPEALKELHDEIEESKYILETDIDPEDPNSGKYDAEIWKRAIKFITIYAQFIYTNKQAIIDPPEILGGPKGSIDILWQNNKYRLLINIPVATSTPISLYGDNRKSRKVEMEFTEEDIDDAIQQSICSLQCGK